METNDIIRRMQAEIDTANIKLIESQAEIARLTEVIESRHGTVAGLIGEVVKAEMGGEADIRSAALEVLKWRQGSLPACGWLRDNDSSRAALQALADAVSAPPAKVQEAATDETLGLPELCDEFQAAAALDAPYTLSPGQCQILFEAMTTPPIAFPIEAATEQIDPQAILDEVSELVGTSAFDEVRAHDLVCAFRKVLAMPAGSEVPPLPTPSKAAEGSIASDAEFKRLMHAYAASIHRNASLEDMDGALVKAGEYADLFFSRKAAVGVLTGWISVGDQLPETGDDDCAWVWAVHTGAIGFDRSPVASRTRYHASLGWQPEGCTSWDWKVTYWIPFPPLPAALTAQVSGQSTQQGT